MVRARAFLVFGLLLVLAPGPASEGQQSGTLVTSPREQFGAAIGDDYFLATYAQLETYWKKLDQQSDRVAVVDIGATEEGRRQWMAIVSSPENLRQLERYREISQRLARAEGLTDAQARALAAEGRAVVVIAGGLHADETLSGQQLIEVVYQLASSDDPETLRVLRDVIVLAIHANPDGHELVASWYMREREPVRRSLAGLPRLYQKYVGHDNNRDFYMGTQAETININRVLYQQWFPQIVYDHHQSAPPGSVMFAPPFREPYNTVIDPLVPEGIELVAGVMHERFAAEGKHGVTQRDGGPYSAWWNGGLRTTANFHNQIGLLTETIGSPTPARDWRFRQSLEYSLTANRAVLDAASRHRETLLFNVYRMGKGSIERGLTTEPYGYVLPADQPDFPTATRFVNALLNAGVTVHRAAASFAVNETRYPAGSYVVKTAQAFRPHVLDMFEPQQHPDDIPYAGAAPRRPYDSAGWTLAYQMGVKFDRIRDAFDGPFEPISGAARPPAGRIVWLPPSPLDDARGAGFLTSHRANDAFIVANRLMRTGERVYWIDGRTMYIAASSTALPVLQKAAAELGLTFTALADAPGGEALQLRPVRIGLADKTGGSVSSGWMRWILERYEFPFEVLAPPALEAGNLRQYDVIVLPDDVVPDVRTMPRIKEFVEGGGTLVAVGGATAVHAAFALPVSNPLAQLTADKYFVPGSVLRARVDNSLPAAYGLEPEVDVFFDNSPVFRLEPGAAARGVRPLAWFSTAAPLRSGWAWGQAHLKDAVIALEASVGRGRLFLFGPPITFRAQSHGTFKFLFNSIYYGPAAGAGR